MYSYREVLWLIGEMTDTYGLAVLIGVVEGDSKRYTTEEVAQIGYRWRERFCVVRRRGG